MLGARRLPNEPTMPPKVGDTWQKWGGRTLTSLIEHVGGLEVFDKIFARIDARDPSPGHVWFAGKEGKLAIKPTSEGQSALAPFHRPVLFESCDSTFHTSSLP
eukprot:m.220797 g.220797  ORF g.220797 m.220797 type:complete len:103 (+) comp15603_c0_seq2:223-531(+)